MHKTDSTTPEHFIVPYNPSYMHPQQPSRMRRNIQQKNMSPSQRTSLLDPSTINNNPDELRRTAPVGHCPIAADVHLPRHFFSFLTRLFFLPFLTYILRCRQPANRLKPLDNVPPTSNVQGTKKKHSPLPPSSPPRYAESKQP